MHSHDDIVLGSVRVRQVGQGQPSQTGVTVMDGDGLHSGSSLLGVMQAESLRHGAGRPPILRTPSGSTDTVRSIGLR
jgi:hypothetical protein